MNICYLRSLVRQTQSLATPYTTQKAKKSGAAASAVAKSDALPSLSHVGPSCVSITETVDIAESAYVPPASGGVDMDEL